MRKEGGFLENESVLGAEAEVIGLGAAAEVELADELSVLLLSAAQDGVLLGLEALLLDLLEVGEQDLLVDLAAVDVGQFDGSVDVNSLSEQGASF